MNYFRHLSHRRPAAALLLGGFFFALLSGCAPGVRWRYEAFDPVFSDSKAKGLLTLVYFRSWYSVQCTRAEESVFNTPELKAATLGMNCVPLDFDWDRPLATTWHVGAVPAFVILDPQGRILESFGGEFSIQAVVDAIGRAKAQFATSTRPSGAP